MYDLQDFEQDVLVQSQTKPVLIDFWAPWCGPCKALGPVLEKIAGERSTEFSLVKINTDENPELSQQFGVKGIPAVKLVFQGKILGEFTGAQAAPAVKAFLDQYLPSIESPEDETLSGEFGLEDLESLFVEGEYDDAIAGIHAMLDENPEDHQAKLLAARILAITNPEESLKLSDALTGKSQVDQFLLEQAKHLAYIQTDPEERSYPESDAKENYLLGLGALKEQKIETAVENFLEVILKDRYYDEDGARKVIIAIFNVLGPEHPITTKFRKDFDRSLY